MIFEYYREVIDPLSLADIILWTMNICLLVGFSFYTAYKIRGRRKEMPQLQYLNAITWIVAFILYATSIILCLIWKYCIRVSTLEFFLVDIFIVLFVSLAVLIKIIHTEISINQLAFYKGYYCTVIMVIFIGFTVLFTPQTIRNQGIFIIIYVILLFIGVSIFPAIYLYMAIKVEGSNRLRALQVFVAALLILIGLIIQPQNIGAFSGIVYFELLSNIALILAPILISIALLIIFISYQDTL